MNLSKQLLRATLLASLGLGMIGSGVASAQDSGGARRGDHADHRGRRGHQDHGHHGPKAGMRHALSQLHLTASQKAEVEAILETARERRGEIFEQGRSDASRERLRALRAETRRLIREVLTPAQRTKLAELKAAHRQERLDRRIDGMTEHLSLTPTQARQVRRILEQAGTRRDRIRERTPDRDARKQAMQAERERTRTAIEAVLTPAQRAEAEAFRAQHRGHRHGKGHRPGRGAPRGR